MFEVWNRNSYAEQNSDVLSSVKKTEKLYPSHKETFFEILLTVLSIAEHNSAENKLKLSQCSNKHNAIKTFLTLR
jgi:response regulator RpfG family c-di-GMP phosphodiesterase